MAAVCMRRTRASGMRALTQCRGRRNLRLPGKYAKAGMKLRAHVFQLTFGTIAPPIVLANVLGILLVQYEQSAVRRGAFDRNRAFITAVDAELRGHVTTLEALRASHLLEAGDFEIGRASCRERV